MAQPVASQISAATSAGSNLSETKTIKKPAAKPIKARDWCFTVNNYTTAEVEEIKAWEDTQPMKYLVFGFERAPHTDTPHLQGYVYWNNARTFTALKDVFPRAHWERARGDSLQNRNYCLKIRPGDGITPADPVPNALWHEAGERPVSNKEKGALGKAFWDDTRALAEAGDFAAIDSKVYITHLQAIHRIASMHLKPVDHLPDCRGIWLHGPPGLGKSHMIRELLPGLYDKCANKWWDGFTEGPACIDDFDLAHACLGHHLKRWADRYAFTAEVKGGTVNIRPTWMAVTSNYTIDQVFGQTPGNELLIEALQRRFKQVHLNSIAARATVKEELHNHIHSVVSLNPIEVVGPLDNYMTRT